jgi:hypothetical protein
VGDHLSPPPPVGCLACPGHRELPHDPDSCCATRSQAGPGQGRVGHFSWSRGVPGGKHACQVSPREGRQDAEDRGHGLGRCQMSRTEDRHGEGRGPRCPGSGHGM